MNGSTWFIDLEKRQRRKIQLNHKGSAGTSPPTFLFLGFNFQRAASFEALIPPCDEFSRQKTDTPETARQTQLRSAAAVPAASVRRGCTHLSPPCQRSFKTFFRAIFPRRIFGNLKTEAIGANAPPAAQKTLRTFIYSGVRFDSSDNFARRAKSGGLAPFRAPETPLAPSRAQYGPPPLRASPPQGPPKPPETSIARPGRRGGIARQSPAQNAPQNCAD